MATVTLEPEQAEEIVAILPSLLNAWSGGYLTGDGLGHALFDALKRVDPRIVQVRQE